MKTAKDIIDLINHILKNSHTSTSMELPNAEEIVTDVGSVVDFWEPFLEYIEETDWLNKEGKDMWQENKLLEMMKANSDIFGEEITHIAEADDEYLCKYFAGQLLKIVDFAYLGNLVKIDCDGFGGIKDARWQDGFSLTIVQCVDIGNYLIDNVMLNRYTKRPRLNWAMTKILANYIINGTPLDWTRYKVTKRNYTTPSNEYERCVELANSCLCQYGPKCTKTICSAECPIFKMAHSIIVNGYRKEEE